MLKALPTGFRILFLLLMRHLRALGGTILFLFFFSLSSFAQKAVSFKIKNTKDTPVPFATIKLTGVTDSTETYQKVTDSSGHARFNLTDGARYTVSVSAVNYNELQKGITISSSTTSLTFTLTDGGKSMKEVVVTSSRPIMRQEDDKTIVEPENLIAASTNAYEVIEKTPGIFMDQDGNVYLNSMKPATIYVNGRELKMSTSDVATMLKNLPPNSIARIEIMRTPSAKYDASGSGGIVNVVLKKGVKIGVTGSVTTGFQQGRYGNQFIGANINNNNGKMTTYLNLQYARRNSYEQVQTNRVFRPGYLLSQDALTKYPANNYYAGFGVEYQLNTKWQLSYDGRINYNNSQTNSTNHSLIKNQSSDSLVSDNTAIVQNKGSNFNLWQGVSATYKIDTSGSEWNLDLSYTYNPNKTNQDINTFFNYPSVFAKTQPGVLDNNLQFSSAETNVMKKYPRKLTMEAGLKTTNVSFKNTTTYTTTNAYKYNENINAAYLQGSKTISGITVKVGTRLENTNMTGHQMQPVDTTFSVHRTDLFPYVYISRNIMKIAGYDLRAYLVYRRTINRPAYEYLNPYPRIVDPYLFENGNPSLRPQFTQNYEANVSVNERPIIAVGVNDTKDIFNQVVYQKDSVAYRTYDNLGTNKEFYFRALGAIPPGKRYFFVIGTQYNHNFYQGLYEGKPLSFEKGTWSFFTYQTFKITPLTQLTLNGFMRLNGQLQFYELTSFGALNMSLTQQFLQKKLIVTVSANDIFFTNNNHFTLQQGSVNASGYRESDTRRFGMNLRYNFGWRKKEESNVFNVESPEKSN